MTTTVFSAKWLLPMDGPLIENGEIVVEDGLIAKVRQVKTPANERAELGDAVLLPGLVNAHTHLEYTALRGFLEDVAFFPWIRTLNATKAYLSAEDWIVSAKLGALECLASGITTIGDNTDSGASLDAARWSGLRGRIYQEFFNIDHRSPVEETANELIRKVIALEGRKGDRQEIGISPHATFTIRPEMFSFIRQHPALRDLPISIHVAESPAEYLLLTKGEGEFAEMFKRRGIEWNFPGTSPTRYVAQQEVLGSKTLLIHCVHQDDEDIALTASSGSAIIHCPKSNAKLGAGIAPLTDWLKKPDLHLGIGTDSAVSNNTLDLFEEMRFGLLAQRGRTECVEGVTAKDMLELATVRGADALNLGASVGSLTAGKAADFIAVRLDQLHLAPASNPLSTLVYSARASDVVLTVVGGQVCYDDGKFVDLDTSGLKLSASEIAEKLAAAGN